MLSAYAVFQLIVFGHMVYLSYKNHSVAIKMVPNGDTPEEIAKRDARFAREVAMLTKVEHKNLVKVVYSKMSFFCISCIILMYQTDGRK